MSITCGAVAPRPLPARDGAQAARRGEEGKYKRYSCSVTATRIDKWLWAARFFKTRELASKACELGRVSSNGVRAKPAREVKVGDMLQLENATGNFVVEVLGLSQQRGPAAMAQSLYRETAESIEARRQFAENRKLMGPLDFAPTKRPSKRDRRLIHSFSGRR
jgi:ribosome-associated heat shock protein Hsp15